VLFGLAGGRPDVRGPLLSFVIHGLLLAAAWQAGQYIAGPEAAWFEPGAAVTYVRLRPGDAIFLPGITGAPAARPAAPRQSTAPRQTKALHLAGGTMAPPPEVRLTAGPALRSPEAGIIALVSHPGAAGVGLPDAPAAPAERGSPGVTPPWNPGVPAVPAVPPPGAEEVRLVHPDDGQFDVVLVQSTPEPYLEPLKGTPVYSVYLDVGTGKPWMLHFCAREPKVEITEHVVRIGAIEPVAAPYPKVTVVPVSLAAGGEPVAISGVIDEDGRLGHLEAFDERSDGVLRRLMSAFESWLFRPARRDGAPVAVQVVLVIPERK
jgi:hypothetical protein